MTLTHDIYNDLIVEAKSEKNKNQISKRHIFDNGQEIIFSVSRLEERRYLYFSIDNADIDKIPKCKGLNTDVAMLPEFNTDNFFCELSQVNLSEAFIYETIAEDICKHLSNAKSAYALEVVASVLRKWQDFFSKKKDILMTEERQMGLYGELKCLDKLISLNDESAVFYWSGCRYETHDFYVNGNAIEVKTTCKKAPYKMHINSEYQLDNNDVTEELFLLFYAFRKSESDGEKLYEIIQRIRNRISTHPHAAKRFEEDLESYGYFDSVADKYIAGYLVRDEKMYVIVEGFPRIIGKDLCSGVSNCTYEVLVDECYSYEVKKIETINRIMRGKSTNE